MTSPTLCSFGEAHIPGAHALSQAVQWPHRPEDWALFLSLSQGAVALDGDRVIATALVTPFGQVATANMIIVDAPHRGAGLGRRVMQTAMDRAQPREWRLIATREGLPMYERMGFVAYGEIVQHQGIVTPETPAGALPDCAMMTDLEALVALDTRATGMERAGLYTTLLRLGGVHVLREGGRIIALAALRDFGRGKVLGPVLARDQGEARALMAPLIASCAGRFLRVDTPTTSGLAPWLAAQGLTHAGGGVQMRLGPKAQISGPQEVFALAAQALG